MIWIEDKSPSLGTAVSWVCMAICVDHISFWIDDYGPGLRTAVSWARMDAYAIHCMLSPNIIRFLLDSPQNNRAGVQWRNLVPCGNPLTPGHDKIIKMRAARCVLGVSGVSTRGRYGLLIRYENQFMTYSCIYRIIYQFMSVHRKFEIHLRSIVCAGTF